MVFESFKASETLIIDGLRVFQGILYLDGLLSLPRHLLPGRSLSLFKESFAWMLFQPFKAHLTLMENDSTTCQSARQPHDSTRGGGLHTRIERTTHSTFGTAIILARRSNSNIMTIIIPWSPLWTTTSLSNPHNCFQALLVQDSNTRIPHEKISYCPIRQSARPMPSTS